MFSTDVFTFVENFLSAATGFVYSYVFSLLVLIRHPLRGPHYLKRRYAKTDVKQVGPLSLHFVTILITLTFMFFGYNTSAAELLKLVTDEDRKASGLALVVASLAGTAGVDLIARYSVLMGWPIGTDLNVAYRARSFTSRRIMATYALVIPCAICAAAAIISLRTSLNLLSWAMPNDYFKIFSTVLTALLVAFVALRVSGTVFTRRAHGPYKEIDHRRRLIAFALTETVLPLGLAIVILSVTFSYNAFSRNYKSDSGSARLSDEDSIQVIDPLCQPMPDKSMDITAIMYNKGKGLAIIKAGSIIIKSPSSKIYAYLDLPSPSPTNEKLFLLSSNTAVRYHASIRNIDVGDMAWECDLAWGLEPYGAISATSFSSDAIGRP